LVIAMIRVHDNGRDPAGFGFGRPEIRNSAGSCYLGEWV
jgi:hypothetical protein